MDLSGRFGPFLDGVIADEILTTKVATGMACRPTVGHPLASPIFIISVKGYRASRHAFIFYAGSRLLHFLCGLPLVKYIALTVGGALEIRHPVAGTSEITRLWLSI